MDELKKVRLLLQDDEREAIEAEFVDYPHERQRIYDLTRDRPLSEQLRVIGYLYDLISAQVSVILAIKHLTRGKKKDAKDNYGNFVDCCAQFKSEKIIYYERLTTYNESRRGLHSQDRNKEVS